MISQALLAVDACHTTAVAISPSPSARMEAFLLERLQRSDATGQIVVSCARGRLVHQGLVERSIDSCDAPDTKSPNAPSSKARSP